MLTMNSIVRYLYRMLTGLWYQHQRELDQRDERIADMEMLIENYKYEINQLHSQLDQYQSIFSVSQSLKTHPEQRRSGVSAPPAILCTLILWEKSSCYCRVDMPVKAIDRLEAFSASSKCLYRLFFLRQHRLQLVSLGCNAIHLCAEYMSKHLDNEWSSQKNKLQSKSRVNCSVQSFGQM